MSYVKLHTRTHLTEENATSPFLKNQKSLPEKVIAICKVSLFGKPEGAKSFDCQFLKAKRLSSACNQRLIHLPFWLDICLTKKFFVLNVKRFDVKNVFIGI